MISRRIKAYPKGLTSAAPADEPEVVELGDLVLHQRGGVPQFRATILVITSADRHQSPIPDLAEGDHFKRHWKGLVGSPVRR